MLLLLVALCGISPDKLELQKCMLCYCHSFKVAEKGNITFLRANSLIICSSKFKIFKFYPLPCLLSHPVTYHYIQHGYICSPSNLEDHVLTFVPSICFRDRYQSACLYIRLLSALYVAIWLLVKKMEMT